MPTLCQARVLPGAPLARAGEPLTFGVPLPPGACRDAAALGVIDAAGRPLVVQAAPSATWEDGSVRWALLDVRADVAPDPAGTPLTIVLGETAPAVSTRVALERQGDEVGIDTGLLRLRVGPGGASPFRDIAAGGRRVASGDDTALVVVDEAGRRLPVTLTGLAVDAAGPVRASVRLWGHAGPDDAPRVLVRWRIDAFAGLAVVRARVTLHNPRAADHPGGIWELGDAGSVLLREVAVTIGPAGGGATAEVSLEPGQPLAAAPLPFLVHQESSGGAQWDGAVHVSRTGVVPLAYRGYRATSGGETHAGLRATPVLRATLGDAAVVVASSRFWQVFPKAYGVAPAGPLRIGILPETTEAHELQGGEQLAHTFVLAFAAEDGVTALPLEWGRAPSVVALDPEWWSTAQAVPALMPQAADARYERLVQAALDGEDTFAAKAEAVDEFGWRHFGDLYADHENGPFGHDVRRVSHYNNQYDALYGCLVQFARSGDRRWWDLADAMALHVAHVDLYRTDRDKSAYNGGLFWHTAHYVDAGRSTHRSYPAADGVAGGGPSNEHCYSTGLALHHYLTGDPDSRAAAVGLGEWVIAIDDGTRARMPLPLLSAADTGLASATAEADYHGPGRGAANAVLALLNAWDLTGRQAFLDKADRLVRRCIHPRDDVAARHLEDVERRWSYTAFLQVLGRYVVVRTRVGGARDAMASYARESLLAYARWMADHEYFYLDRPERLEFPNETWAAQEMRKTEVFDLAAACAATADERARFAGRGRWFHARTLDALAAHPMRTRTRPLVLLLSYGFAHAWHEAHRDALPLLPAGQQEFGRPEVFVPQRVIAVRRAKLLAVAGAASAAAIAAVLFSLLP